MQRLLAHMLMATLTLGGYGAPLAQETKAADLLTQARAALGGDAALRHVTGIAATGTIRRSAGDRQLSGALVLRIQLPNRLLRTESLSVDGGLTLETDQGVDGNRLLRASRMLNAPPGAIIRTPPAPPSGSDAEADALRAARADLVRLSVALLLRAPDDRAVDFAYVGLAEAPDGKAEVIDVKERDSAAFTMKLFLDTTTHLPLMMSYRGIAPRVVVQSQRPGSAAPRGDLRQAPPPLAGEVVDIQVFLDDYRRVEGVLFPHHVTRSVAGETTEEWAFTSFDVNPTFKPGTFEVR